MWRNDNKVYLSVTDFLISELKVRVREPVRRQALGNFVQRIYFGFVKARLTEFDYFQLRHSV
ncbi:MAG: hypothetical protein JAZ17_15140 [Candidatus Thiodiazotropha endolucinida]|nr:hypothetical protein [Candidatus Thiodiazotropha taylori]MCG8094933.1 hypothetical protein [Candidatus Thiodiazotropha endolucinida]MCW4320247.1 hypothetical protein [Candidatus Thiodiazotropha taylori]MCW4343671.1 hypothetical protein [Candidatus Thiodiazotropha endolucinida]